MPFDSLYTLFAAIFAVSAMFFIVNNYLRKRKDPFSNTLLGAIASVTITAMVVLQSFEMNTPISICLITLVVLPLGLTLVAFALTDTNRAP